GDTSNPLYRVTTDWGAVDGYHAPSRYPGTIFPGARAHAWTIDPVDSPRNSGWYLCALAARRALTFLQQQPQVDSDRLGVYGHSMGGKLTILTATDPRVAAAAPSCGGVSDRDNASKIFEQTLCDNHYLKQIRCPIMFLSPSNDFHGRMDGLQSAVSEIKSAQWRVTCSPHHNHQDTSPYEVATQLWFDTHLKGERKMPDTPRFTIQWDQSREKGKPTVRVLADDSQSIESVDVYYTRQGQSPGEPNDRENTMARYWFHHTASRAQDDRNSTWNCELELRDNDRPLWVYANVTYRLDKPIVGAGYYYRVYKANRFVLSSLMTTYATSDLADLVPASDTIHQPTIEEFKDGWQHAWYTYRESDWPRRTHKIYEPRWHAPSDDAKLQLSVHIDQANPFVVGLDQYAAIVQLKGDANPQSIVLSRSDFKNADGESPTTWTGMHELRLGHDERLRLKSGKGSKRIGGNWTGPPPTFHSLRWSEE
ncbi:MAG: dienelactone hydrolase family protein, partial [Planctomycetota bacterium]